MTKIYRSLHKADAEKFGAGSFHTQILVIVEVSLYKFLYHVGIMTTSHSQNGSIWDYIYSSDRGYFFLFYDEVNASFLTRGYAGVEISYCRGWERCFTKVETLSY